MVAGTAALIKLPWLLAKGAAYSRRDHGSDGAQGSGFRSGSPTPSQNVLPTPSGTTWEPSTAASEAQGTLIPRYFLLDPVRARDIRQNIEGKINRLRNCPSFHHIDSIPGLRPI